MKTLYESILSSTRSGKAPLIKAWLEEHGIKNYTINTRGEIDIDGDIKLTYKNIKEFPSFIQFGTVKGNFDCKNNNLISLKGVPREVKGNFDCSFNNLTSLEGAPREVGGSFNCYDNRLTTLEGAPKEIGIDFNCYSNKLTTLKGAPKKIGRSFNCCNNQLTSLNGAPKNVGGSFVGYKNKTKFTKDDVNKVCKVEKMIYV